MSTFRPKQRKRIAKKLGKLFDDWSTDRFIESLIAGNTGPGEDQGPLNTATARAQESADELLMQLNRFWHEFPSEVASISLGEIFTTRARKPNLQRTVDAIMSAYSEESTLSEEILASQQGMVDMAREASDRLAQSWSDMLTNAKVTFPSSVTFVDPGEEAPVNPIDYLIWEGVSQQDYNAIMTEREKGVRDDVDDTHPGAEGQPDGGDGLGETGEGRGES